MGSRSWSATRAQNEVSMNRLNTTTNSLHTLHTATMADGEMVARSPSPEYEAQAAGARDETAVFLITCLDGRIQAPAQRWAAAYFPASSVDILTMYAPDMLLTHGDVSAVDDLRRRVEQAMLLRGIVGAHGAPALALVGHLTCEMGPQTWEACAALIAQAVATIAAWDLPLALIVGVLIDGEGQPEVVCRSSATPRPGGV